jgi:hypothetical protein
MTDAPLAFQRRNGGSADMGDAERLAEAIRRIDDANAEDPRTEAVNGVDQPRELLFARRVHEWVMRLAADPPEALLLAARAHTLRRWMVPRDRYPMTNIGYHEWRDACATFHAQETERILRDVGYPQDAIDRVTALITKQDWESDPDARTLEDADCLAFLESKLHRYLDEWDEKKTIGILRRTLKLDPRCIELLRRAGA